MTLGVDVGVAVAVFVGVGVGVSVGVGVGVSVGVGVGVSVGVGVESTMSNLVRTAVTGRSAVAIAVKRPGDAALVCVRRRAIGAAGVDGGAAGEQGVRLCEAAVVRQGAQQGVQRPPGHRQPSRLHVLSLSRLWPAEVTLPAQSLLVLLATIVFFDGHRAEVADAAASALAVLPLTVLLFRVQGAAGVVVDAAASVSWPCCR